MSFDTYVASGEESAQEQQFLQALASTIQSREASPVPKYATQFFCNFAGRYDTLAVNNPMIIASQGAGYVGISSYLGTFIALDPWRTLEDSGFTPLVQIVGGLTSNNLTAGSIIGSGQKWFTAAPDYVNSVLDIAYPNPAVNISQVIPPVGFPPTSYINYFPFLAFYRQSFLATPFYILVPKWTRSLTVGMRLYDNLGILQPILIASKTNAKWQSLTVNESTAPDGSYKIEKIPNAQVPSVPQFLQYAWGTSYGMVTSMPQFANQNKQVFPVGIDERQVGGQSQITLRMANYKGAGIIPPLNFSDEYWRLQYWSNTAPRDLGGSSIPNLRTSPLVPDQALFPKENCTLTFSIPLPPSLPYTYYFRLDNANTPPPFPPAYVPFTGTYAIEYPANYPAIPPTLAPIGASYDWIRVTISNYAAVVNPVPTGFPTPPVGMPTFNSLALATIPLIAMDITQPT